mmetsp:Transcript_6147/g.7574  ORF Transcript_6147/g.7574 Transcript_6147/m.7574 type:complete len:113 (+) Transcript_6147:311-649(+)
MRITLIDTQENHEREMNAIKDEWKVKNDSSRQSYISDRQKKRKQRSYKQWREDYTSTNYNLYLTKRKERHIKEIMTTFDDDLDMVHSRIQDETNKKRSDLKKRTRASIERCS